MAEAFTYILRLTLMGTFASASILFAALALTGAVHPLVGVATVAFFAFATFDVYRS